MVQKLTLPNDIETIPQMSEFVEMACEEAGFDISTTMSLNLAIEEAVVNVMSYAYPEGERGYVDIEASAENGGITFRIIDSGKPFDPTSQGEVDTTLSAEQRSIGGLGIHLVRSIMDSVTYQRDADMNILTLQKLLPKDSEL